MKRERLRKVREDADVAAAYAAELQVSLTRDISDPIVQTEEDAVEQAIIIGEYRRHVSGSGLGSPFIRNAEA